MKLLLLGMDGQVGWELQRSLAPLGTVVALGRSDRGRYCGDLRAIDDLRRTVRELRPDVIVNAAAYTRVDKAEGEPELAHVTNAVAPGVLAEEVGRYGAMLVHYSTDYVFDGSGEKPWHEEDVKAPINVYGLTKLEGEEARLSLKKIKECFGMTMPDWQLGGLRALTEIIMTSDRSKV